MRTPKLELPYFLQRILKKSGIKHCLNFVPLVLPVLDLLPIQSRPLFFATRIGIVVFRKILEKVHPIIHFKIPLVMVRGGLKALLQPKAKPHPLKLKPADAPPRSASQPATPPV